jgi:hypothetical protein
LFSASIDGRRQVRKYTKNDKCLHLAVAKICRSPRFEVGALLKIPGPRSFCRHFCVR